MAQKFKQFRAYLIKENYTLDEDILKNIESLTAYPLKNVPYNGTLYVKRPYKNQPPWVSYLMDFIDGQFDTKMYNASTSSALIIRLKSRIIALVFGHGRSLLNPSSFERDFGLKVVLNRMDPDCIRSIDHRQFDELTLQSRQQTSKGSTLDSFTFDIDQNLLRQAAGIPDNQYLQIGTRLAGSDSLLLVNDIDVQSLAKKSEEWVQAYQDDKYKIRFSFIDHMRTIRDPQQIANLNDKLIESIKTKDFSRMHMAPPEPIDWEYVDGFAYSSKKNQELYQDLDIVNFMETVKEGIEPSIQYLKNRRVFLKTPNSDVLEGRWSVLDCIVYEVDIGKEFYVFTCGQWYSVNKDFVSNVNSKVSSLVSSTLKLPPAIKGEKEGDYNKRIGASQGYAIIDTKCARIGGSPIEPCDLFTPAKQFIHVKRKTRSATLSHLFSQGSVSAECFIRDQTFRDNFVKILKSLKHSAMAKEMPSKKPNPAEFEIVYAIVSKNNAKWPLSLPFFSRLTLMTTANHLESMAFNVSLVHVEQQ